MSIEEKVSVDFLRWYLNNKISGFREVTRHDQVLHNCKNVFSKDNNHDLTINLLEGECTDSQGQQYPISWFIAKCRNDSEERTIHHLEVEFASWQEREKARKKYQKFVRDEKNMRWKKKTGEDSYEEVTEYDLIINSVIESYDLKVDKWSRKFECTLRWYHLGKLRTKEVELEPEQTHSFNNLSDAIWKEVTTAVTQNMTNHETRKFWQHLETYYEPRIVREFKHFGFIEFEDEKYFLAENVLMKFPDHPDRPLELIAQEDGAFQVEENKYIKPSDDPVHLPNFELGVPQNGRFKTAMNRLYDEEMFEEKLKKVINEFCSMIGGDGEFRQWGKLIVSYVFSFIFFDDIYDHFKHVIFLYFYGEGNVGKGEVVKRIFDFYGINYLDSLQTPPPRSVDEALQEKSQIPLWVDEHVPQVPGQDHKIEDQAWNSWFELKMRRTNIKKGVSYGIERKAVRTMPVFCSNFKPRSDHLLSRSLIIEYRRDRRGPEKHVLWLKREKELLQRLLMSYMKNYKLIDRNAFVWDMDRIRTKLKEDVKAELDKRTGNAILQDRQLSQFSILITVYHWLSKEYRVDATNLYHESQRAANETDKEYREDLYDQLDIHLNDLPFDNRLYRFVKKQTIRSAVTAAQHNPLTDYIETIGTLIEGGDITEKHFHWMEDGTLKIWAKAVWDEYLAAKKGTDDIVRREIVEEKLKELSVLDNEGGLKSQTWTPPNANSPVRCKGFYIPKANENELLRLGFHLHKFGPPQAQIPSNNGQTEEPEEANNTVESKQLDFDEDPPF